MVCLVWTGQHHTCSIAILVPVIQKERSRAARRQPQSCKWERTETVHSSRYLQASDFAGGEAWAAVAVCSAVAEEAGTTGYLSPRTPLPLRNLSITSASAPTNFLRAAAPPPLTPRLVSALFSPRPHPPLHLHLAFQLRASCCCPSLQYVATCGKPRPLHSAQPCAPLLRGSLLGDQALLMGPRAWWPIA